MGFSFGGGGEALKPKWEEDKREEEDLPRVYWGAQACWLSHPVHGPRALFQEACRGCLMTLSLQARRGGAVCLSEERWEEL